MNHNLAYKTNLNKFKRIETTENMFSDNKRIQFEINNRHLQNPKYLEVNTFLNNSWVKIEVRIEIRKCF